MVPGPPASPPPLLTAGLSRRKLLAAAGVGGLLLGGGAWVWKTLRGFGPPRAGYFVFDDSEAEVLEKLADAVYPGPPEVPFGAAEIRVAQFVDLYVHGLYDDTQTVFRMLVRTLNLSTVLGYGAAFQYLSRKRRQQAFAEWGDSSVRVRRAGYQSLLLPMCMGYFEDKRVRAAVGLTSGCPVEAMGDRPDLWSMALKERG
jgi:hypothetical protein